MDLFCSGGGPTSRGDYSRNRRSRVGHMLRSCSLTCFASALSCLLHILRGPPIRRSVDDRRAALGSRGRSGLGGGGGGSRFVFFWSFLSGGSLAAEPLVRSWVTVEEGRVVVGWGGVGGRGGSLGGTRASGENEDRACASVTEARSRRVSICLIKEQRPENYYIVNYYIISTITIDRWIDRCQF